MRRGRREEHVRYGMEVEVRKMFFFELFRPWQTVDDIKKSVRRAVRDLSVVGE